MKIDYRGRQLSQDRRPLSLTTPEDPHDGRYDQDQYLRNVAVVEPWVEAIQKRGGQVIFVRFPSSGTRWALDERQAPKALYWDAFAKRAPSRFTSRTTLNCPDSIFLTSPIWIIGTRLLSPRRWRIL